MAAPAVALLGWTLKISCAAAPTVTLNAVLVACAQLKPRRSLALLRQTEKEYLSGPRWYAQAPSDDAIGGNAGKRRT